MRIRIIDYNNATPIDDVFMGYMGEHNETALRIVPPESMLNNADIVSFVVALGSGGRVYHSAATTREAAIVTGYVETPLFKDVTGYEEIEIQLEGYDNNRSLLAKTEVVYGYFEVSVDGEDAIADEDAGIIADIAANTAARHTHLNKALLDEIPAYETTDENKALTVGTNGLEWREAGSSGSGAVEIWESGTTAKYTATELSNYADANAHFCYKGYPVINYGYQLVPREFYFTYITTRATTNMNIAQYVAKCKVTDAKTVTEGTTRVIPIKVNNETANADGNITLPAPVWDAIQNKPASFPPSTHTHTYSEITNTPDLSVYALSASLGAVATSNDYADLDNLPTIPDISGCEVTANKVTSLSSASTDTQYPSAKCVYDYVAALVGNADTLLGSGVIV